MNEVIELFPTPLLRCEQLVDAASVAALRAHLLAQAQQQNTRSSQLSHSHIVRPADDPLLQQLAAQLTPAIVEFGGHLFGQALAWRIKEMWVNVLEAGGHQGVHNHANSFVSGILYLSEADASSRTAFLRGLGGRDYAFSNANAHTRMGPYNAEKWLAPQPSPGDVLLFPSYLLHEVPVNRGGERVTLAFNAIPERLDSWGYAINFN